MSITFEKFIKKIIKAIDDSNTYLIDKITNPDTKFKLSCIKPNIHFDKYYEILKKKWDTAMEDLMTQMDDCDSFSKIMMLYNVVNVGSKIDFKTLEEAKDTKNFSAEGVKKLISKNFSNSDKMQNIVLDILADSMIKKSDEYGLDKDVVKSLHNLIKVISSRSICWLWDIISVLATAKYKSVIKKKSKEQIVALLKNDIKFVTDTAKSLNVEKMELNFKNIIEIISSKLTNLHSVKEPPKIIIPTEGDTVDLKKTGLIENELDKLIPNSAGAMKSFFITMLSAYYNNLHPIIWAQIIKQMLVNFVEEMPLSEEALFQFISKHLLLNSGPFILKILQQIRPNIPQNLLVKYNLNKLKYPLMLPEQYNLILSKVVKRWDLYKVDGVASASVGMVFFVHRVDRKFKFVIKVAKPLSIAQSCFEYSSLINVFKKGTCKHEFVKNMLKATGEELYAPREIKNVNEFNEMYSMKYSELFNNANLPEQLTTVKVVDNIMVPNCWFAFAMTHAEGIPLSSLVEGTEKKLLKDTLYRATLHRCLDLLVYKFFIGFVQKGKYHGDLHAGNAYFSYVLKRLTVIDFGAVGEIDVFSDDPVTKALIDIILMSVYYNYTDLLDTTTMLINGKCAEEKKIDMKSKSYKSFRKQLKKYKIQNMMHIDRDTQLTEEFKNKMLDPKRVNAETPKDFKEFEPVRNKSEKFSSPYDYLDLKPEKVPTEVIDNVDALPYDLNVNEKSKIVSFSHVMSLIIEYYATEQINIAVKFAEFYELIKAYKLLMDVLGQLEYPSQRITIVMNTMFYDTGNLKKLLEINAVLNMFSAYTREKSKYEKLKEKMKKIKAITKEVTELKKHKPGEFWLSK